MIVISQAPYILFSKYDNDIADKNHLINQQSRKSRKSAFDRKCSAPETFFGLIYYTYWINIFFLIYLDRVYQE